MGHARVDPLSGAVHDALRREYVVRRGAARGRNSDHSGRGQRNPSAWATLGPCDAILLLSHYHWDHIQKSAVFQFGVHSHQRRTRFRTGVRGTGAGRISQRPDDDTVLPGRAVPDARRRRFSGDADGAIPELGTATISVARLSHPSVTYGYRIEERGSTFVYVSDNEVDIAPPELLTASSPLPRTPMC